MSVDFNVYVGPYLDIREPVTRSVFDHCADHNSSDEAEFCSQCGRNKRARRYPRTSGVLDDGFWSHANWEDHLIDASHGARQPDAAEGVRTVRAISNFPGFGVQLDRGDDTGAHDIPTAEGFEEKLWPEIRRIRELGCSVEVKLGVLVWYS